MDKFLPKCQPPICFIFLFSLFYYFSFILFQTAEQNANNDNRLKDALKQQLDRHQEALITRVDEKEKEVSDSVTTLDTTNS